MAGAGDDDAATEDVAEPVEAVGELVEVGATEAFRARTGGGTYGTSRTR